MRSSKKSRGIFIVIEGIDGSGKATQTELLKNRLGKSGRFLTGEFGKLDEVNPHLAVLPFMIDEYTWSRDVARPWINKGGIILSNRYFTSNVHNIAKLNGRARKKYRDWLWRMGYGEFGILRPDLVLFLDVPPKISLKLNKTKIAREYLKGKKQDIAERRRDHQLAAYKSYLAEVRLNNWWLKIRCLTNGKLDSPVAIHCRIWEKVFLLLSQHQYAKRSPSILDLAGTVTPKRNRGVSVLKAREYMERHYKRI